MLYWGARGVTRDTDAAVNYYKMGAEAEDPVSQYDYGIILLKVLVILHSGLGPTHFSLNCMNSMADVCP